MFLEFPFVSEKIIKYRDHSISSRRVTVGVSLSGIRWFVPSVNTPLTLTM